MAELPGYLRWLEWVAGSDWPAGDENGMWDLARDWRATATTLREILDDIDAAKAATVAAYPQGDGVDKMVEQFDSLRSGDQSIERLADFVDSVAESVDGVSTEIEYAKLMMISSLALLAAEIAAAWIFPPTAPAVEAAAIGFTRVGIRVIAQRVMQKVIHWTAELVGAKAATFLVRHMAIDTVIGTMQELGIQGYQVAQGHRGDVSWSQVTVAAVSSAASGGAASPVGELVGHQLSKIDGMRPWISGAVTGATAGTAGAFAGFAASVGAQFTVDTYRYGWDKAVENATETEFDWRMVTAGTSNGALTGASRMTADLFYRARHPQWYVPPTGQAAQFGPQPDGSAPAGAGKSAASSNGTHGSGMNGAKVGNGAGISGGVGANGAGMSKVAADSSARPANGGSARFGTAPPDGHPGRQQAGIAGRENGLTTHNHPGAAAIDGTGDARAGGVQAGRADSAVVRSELPDVRDGTYDGRHDAHPAEEKTTDVDRTGPTEPSTAEPETSTGDGAAQPPAEPPLAGSGSDDFGDRGPGSEWFEQMRREQADWEAGVAADHAAWLRDIADGQPDDRWSRLRAEQAEWNARMASERAAWLAELAPQLVRDEELVRRLAARTEYDRLVEQRQSATREREFIRAKFIDRARDLGIEDPVSWLRRDPGDRGNSIVDIEEMMRSHVVDIEGGMEEASRRIRHPVAAAEQQRRRRIIEKLIAGIEQFDDLGDRIQRLDEQIAEIGRGIAGVDRPPIPEVAAELDQLAQRRAEELRRIKPRREMRDDLASRLGMVDGAGRVDEAALDAQRLGETVAGLRDRARTELAGAAITDAGFAIRQREIDALADSARDVHRAHNAIGRTQDEMARVAGVWRALAEAEGGWMATERVGYVAGDRPRIIVFGPRAEVTAPRADHDAALADALRRSAAVAQALTRPETTIEYRRVLADRRDNWRLGERMNPPEVERLSTGWVGGRRMDMTSWRDAAGVWHHVDPTRPDWTGGRDTGTLPKKFTPKDPPDGVSGWAMTDVVNDITLPIEDVQAGKVPESTLPVHAPQAPQQYDTTGVDPKDLFSQHWGSDSYGVVRLLLMAAQVPKHPAVKTWIQRHPRIGRWVQARPWLRHMPPFGTVFRDYEFAPPERNIQPMHRPWDAGDHVPPSARVVVPEGLRAEWERDIAAWQRVQDWADAEYERFRADDGDIDRIVDGIDTYRREQQRDAARHTVEIVWQRLVEPHSGIDPTGDVDARIARIHDEVDRLGAELSGRFATDDPDAVRDTVVDIRESLLYGVDPAGLVDALAESMRDDVPVFEQDELQQIKRHLMVDKHRVRDHTDPAGTYVRKPMDQLADVAEAWNRLVEGNPLPQDFVLLHDALAEARFLADNPLATWQQANAHAIGLGYHWDADRPPLTDWRAGIPYAPPLLPPNPGYLPPTSGTSPHAPQPAPRLDGPDGIAPQGPSDADTPPGSPRPRSDSDQRPLAARARPHGADAKGVEPPDVGEHPDGDGAAASGSGPIRAGDGSLGLSGAADTEGGGSLRKPGAWLRSRIPHPPERYDFALPATLAPATLPQPPRQSWPPPTPQDPIAPEHPTRPSSPAAAPVPAELPLPPTEPPP
ncbi:hypothetical protein [Nocardia donostiensis]|uniref:Outer membrane channel protein CpnT-like N-terminal domain-containing protein n=1 Tax=Nocardia donostiensis TaxID=1538463 RepID=A0A1W0B6M8_9NOCA|nr:hypothetical protein [Nocardia donostiensis]ONM50521.1 hypothetical protein B0T46_00985 [Nocardia donostiensis]OQS18170.1 hypothetical protein B0T44_21095 [Nocardia donostiensis]